MPNASLNVVELYAGTARSAESFRQWERCKIALLADIDSFAADTYLWNYPQAPYWVTDLGTKVKARDIELHIGGKVDILLGCPPCQGFSDTGSRNLKDPRNQHLSRFRKFIEGLKPKAVAMENVPRAANTGTRFKHFCETMDQLGYQSTWGIINSALRGSAQCRYRLVYIGILEGAGQAPIIPLPTYGGEKSYFNYSAQQMAQIKDNPIAMLSRPPAVHHIESMAYQENQIGSKPIPNILEVIGDLPEVGSDAAQKLTHCEWNHSAEMITRMKKVPEGGRWEDGKDHFSHSYGRLHRYGLARTVTTYFSNPGSGRFWHPTEERAISIREAARIQGFPDSFKFLPAPTQNTRLIGNALEAHIAETIYNVIRNSLK